ncbi:heme-binding protein 2-like [Halichoeres trimaculatus]|uniref:heme-binding protein 2-like n=1 Tax=Halichoeres trimaculatus TaxID=147232 RepID=UPI003D9F55D9
MILLTGLVGVLLVLTAEAKVGNAEGTECTETKECLLYELVCDTGEYEVRKYGAAKWVSTKEKSLTMDLAQMAAFKRLFGYISGENERGKKIEMTAPVIVEIPEKNFWERVNFTMSFLLPSEYQQNPPRATNDEVYIHEMPEMQMYVQSYGGWMTSFSDYYHARCLKDVLDEEEAMYGTKYHYGVSYNSPMTLFNRHNEVWVKVVGKPVCSSSGGMFN